MKFTFLKQDSEVHYLRKYFVKWSWTGSVTSKLNLVSKRGILLSKIIVVHWIHSTDASWIILCWYFLWSYDPLFCNKRILQHCKEMASYDLGYLYRLFLVLKMLVESKSVIALVQRCFIDCFCTSSFSPSIHRHLRVSHFRLIWGAGLFGGFNSSRSLRGAMFHSFFYSSVILPLLLFLVMSLHFHIFIIYLFFVLCSIF